MNRKQLAVSLVLVSFLCQGMASLIYQVSWEQAMEKIVGLAVPTMSMIVSTFLLGMGLGAYLFSKVRLNYHSAGKFYCFNQFLLFALGLVFAGSKGLDFLSYLSVDNIDWLPFAYLIRLALLCLYLLPAAMLIGASFPILLSLSGFYQLNLSARRIYLFNLIGSAIGAILTGFVLLPYIGIAKSSVIAAIIHLLAALPIIMISRLCKLASTSENEGGALPSHQDQKTFSKGTSGCNPPLQKQQAATSSAMGDVEAQNTHLPAGTANMGSVNLAPTIPNLAPTSPNLTPTSLKIAPASPMIWRLLKLAEGGQFQKSVVDSNRMNLPQRFSKAFLLLAVVAIAGFFNMFLELIFIRYYSLIMGSSTWAYSLVLVIMFLALGCGTFLTGRIVQPRLTISLLFLLAGASLLFNCFFLSQLPLIFAGFKCLIGFLLSSVLILIFTIFPVCLCLGAVLPCCFNAAEMKGDLSPIKPGQIYAVNLFAAVTGCLAGGIIAIPFLNLFSNHAIYLAFILSALAVLVTGIIICIPIILSSKKIAWIAAALSVLLCLIIWQCVAAKVSWNEAALTAGLDYLSPDDFNAIKRLPEAVNLPLLFYKEGLNSIVSVTKNEQLNVICLKTDGQMEAALPFDPDLPAPSSDEKTQIMLGLCPYLFGSTSPKNAFLLGYGTGITARSISLNDAIKNLTVAELEPAVIEASHFFIPCYGQIFSLNEPAKKMQIRIMDGRCLLSLLNKRYDMIVCQPGEPSRSSCGHLYTLEFWQLAKSRLQPGGVFCQWLPLYAMDRSNLMSLCRTFLCVFPHTFIIKLDRSAELILLGFNGKAVEAPVDIAPAIKQVLMQLGFADYNRSLNKICLTPQSLPSWMTNSDQDQHYCLNQDDFPFVQYRLQALLAKQGNSVDTDIEKMISGSFSPTPASAQSK